jgi:class 3 adenylate cyclase
VVQLSARITDKASADQIYVSEIVRGICAGKSFNFKNLGGFAMKGFGDDITLFEVIWDKTRTKARKKKAPNLTILFPPPCAPEFAFLYQPRSTDA